MDSLPPLDLPLNPRRRDVPKPLSVVIVKDLETAEVNAFVATEKEARAYCEDNKVSDKIVPVFVEGVKEIVDATFLSLRDLARLNNALSGETLQKFQDRVKAAIRLVPLLQKVTKKLAVTEQQSLSKGRGRKPGCNLRPGNPDLIKPCKAGTAFAKLVDLLVVGGTLSMVMHTLGPRYSKVSALSVLNWDLNKRKGYGIKSETYTQTEAHLKGLQVEPADVLKDGAVLVYRLIVPQSFNGRNGPGTPPNHT